MHTIFKRTKSMIDYWELLIILASNQIKIAYKHTVIGFIWAVIVPLFTVLIFRIAFSVIIKVQTGAYPYFIFTLTGIVPFSYFTTCINSASMNLINNAPLLKRVYFPRTIVPISMIFSNFPFFLINLCIILFFIGCYGLHFSWFLFLLPLVIFIQLLFTIGISLIVSSLQVLYRDVKYIVEIILLAWFYFTPVFYPLESAFNVSERFFELYMLNPMTQLVILYRIILLPGYHNKLPPGVNMGYLLLYTFIVSVIIYFFGFFIFRKNENKFIDLL